MSDRLNYCEYCGIIIQNELPHNCPYKNAGVKIPQCETGNALDNLFQLCQAINKNDQDNNQSYCVDCGAACQDLSQEHVCAKKPRLDNDLSTLNANSVNTSRAIIHQTLEAPSTSSADIAQGNAPSTSDSNNPIRHSSDQNLSIDELFSKINNGDVTLTENLNHGSDDDEFLLCPFCNTIFSNEEELSSHVEDAHISEIEDELEKVCIINCYIDYYFLIII